MQDRVEKENQKVIHFFGDLYKGAKQDGETQAMQHEMHHKNL